MTLRTRLALALLPLVAPGTASAQGLVAFPWVAKCPEVDGAPRCVWVADASQLLPTRPREDTTRGVELRFLNPGSTGANVFVQVRNDMGEALAGRSRFVAAGHLERQGAADAIGYFVLQSDQPLAVWAWTWEQKLETRGSAADHPPTAMSSHSIQVIPVDCSLAGEESKSVAFICGVTGPPK
jgi:hypothetical protein